MSGFPGELEMWMCEDEEACPSEDEEAWGI
jgi:hypothetical protein